MTDSVKPVRKIVNVEGIFAEMQCHINDWKEKYWRTSCLPNTKHTIHIHWEETK